ncbi:hypothetical protein ACHAWF_009955 [Thalassiosira exigua]
MNLSFLRKSRHCQDEDDVLLGLHSNSIQTIGGEDPEEATPRTGTVQWDLSYGSTATPAQLETANEEGIMRTRRVHHQSYTPREHVKVLFKLRRSRWPQVLPFIFANLAWLLFIFFARKFGVVDLTVRTGGGWYSNLAMLVSFLIVSRCVTAYKIYMRFREHLATFYRACRELVRYTMVYTQETQTEDAARWRQEVCYRTILLLRVTVDALIWSSMERTMWGKSYFEAKPEPDVSEHISQIKCLLHGQSSNIAENLRAPLTSAHMLSEVIMRHRHCLGDKMPAQEYNKLLGFVDQLVMAFHGCRVLILTPYPFSLVQLGRIFLFVFVGAMPMIILKEARFWGAVFVVTISTFGFVGLEYVSMALMDPFGDDTDEFDVSGMNLLVYEDIYLATYRTDGPEAAVSLRNRVLARCHQGRELDCYKDDLKEHMWERPELWRRASA